MKNTPPEKDKTLPQPKVKKPWVKPVVTVKKTRNWTEAEKKAVLEIRDSSGKDTSNC